MGLHDVLDYEKKAKEVLDKDAWYYYNYGRERKLNFQDSVDAFARYRIRSRVLEDVSNRTLATTVLGQPLSYPICASPTGCHKFAHPDGERETARGVKAADTLMTLSTDSNTNMKDVAAAAPGGLRWMGLYLYRDRELIRHFVREAERNGFSALVVVVDSPVEGLDTTISEIFRFQKKSTNPVNWMANYEADIPSSRAAFAAGDVNYYQYMIDNEYNPRATWEDIKWIKSITRLPIVCKGILTAESARDAAAAGVDGILVSAHGGRQMDGAPAPIDAVEEVADAVRGLGIEVYLDGGVRTGSDVFKALGRGARAVFVGRPILWGLACEGSEGVTRVLHILRDQLDAVLAISGCTSPEKIPPGTVVHQSYYHRGLRASPESKL